MKTSHLLLLGGAAYLAYWYYKKNGGMMAATPSPSKPRSTAGLVTPLTGLVADGFGQLDDLSEPFDPIPSTQRFGAQFKAGCSTCA